MAALTRSLLIFLLVVTAGAANADDKRAHVNYLIHCQGCHLPGAAGFPGRVPRMRGFLGYFLHSQEGREFIVQVPGVATSTLSNEQLSELINWLLVTYSKDQLPENFVAYTGSELAELRPKMQLDPDSRRREILKNIASRVPALANTLPAALDY